jgi:hypothetical protein
LTKLDRSLSLYESPEGKLRIYIRYSKLHGESRTFYGLRRGDLQRLEGHPSVICFLWDGQREPLLVPYSEFEDVFRELQPAADGQYKCQVILSQKGAELYIARAGRFDAEGHLGWAAVDSQMKGRRGLHVPDLSHAQVQSILGAIGNSKGFDVWIPLQDRGSIDPVFAQDFSCRSSLPEGCGRVSSTLEEVDVIWIKRGTNRLSGLFEVEHTTTVYSALLRFNDLQLAYPDTQARFSVVAKDSRRSLFVRQLNRPTFQASGLNELCTFHDYDNVFLWHSRLTGRREKEDQDGQKEGRQSKSL